MRLFRWCPELQRKCRSLLINLVLHYNLMKYPFKSNFRSVLVISNSTTLIGLQWSCLCLSKTLQFLQTRVSNDRIPCLFGWSRFREVWLYGPLLQWYCQRNQLSYSPGNPVSEKNIFIELSRNAIEPFVRITCTIQTPYFSKSIWKSDLSFIYYEQ